MPVRRGSSSPTRGSYPLIPPPAKVKEDKKEKVESTPTKKSKKTKGKIDKSLISGPVSSPSSLTALIHTLEAQALMRSECWLVQTCRAYGL